MRLVRGASGPIISDVQKLLVQRGFDVPIGGRLCDDTYRALKMFQIGQGMPATGVVDSTTWKLLRANADLSEETVVGAESPNNTGAISHALVDAGFGVIAMDLHAAAISSNLKLGFIAALAGVESGWGRSPAFQRHHNVYGLLDPETRAIRDFSTYREGIDEALAILIRTFLTADAAAFMGSTLRGIAVYGCSVNPEYEDPLIWIDAISEAWMKFRRN